MKNTVLLENTATRAGLRAEHGLSLYLEVGDLRILFDAGPSDALVENGETLGVDLKQVDVAVLSHGHSDHADGFRRFREINPGAKIYASRYAFGPYYNAHGKYIGLDPELTPEDGWILTSERVSLGAGITLCPGVSTALPGEASGLQVMTGTGPKPDDFRHEQYLLVEEGGKRVLISGCSHRGVENIVACFRPDVLIGGFHVKDIPPIGEGKARLTALANRLAAEPTLYYTCHCTGGEQFAVMKEILGPRLQYAGGGTVLEI